MDQYGLDINKLSEFITTPSRETTSWGSHSIAIAEDGGTFSLQQAVIEANKAFPLEIDFRHEATIFVEEGEISIDGAILNRGEIFSFGPGTKKAIEARERSIVYIFEGIPDTSPGYGLKRKTSDYRDKYWGSIETIMNRAYAGKRIFCRKHEHSSLEFHCQKVESYFIHSGKLLVRLRAGRAEDRFFELAAGSAILIPPGLMHQRGGKEDTVIIEISTHSEDADSYLVEDGQKTEMPNLIP